MITNPALGNMGITGASGIGFFSKLLPALITISFVIGALIFFYMLITGAIAWISSGGDKNAIESARGKITNAIIGIVLLFATFAIIKAIEYFFGISILTLDISALVIQ